MIHIKKNSDYSRLTEYLESMIAAGVYQTGDRLPPLRELSQRFDINLDTARRGIWRAAAAAGCSSMAMPTGRSRDCASACCSTRPT